MGDIDRMEAALARDEQRRTARRDAVDAVRRFEALLTGGERRAARRRRRRGDEGGRGRGRRRWTARVARIAARPDRQPGNQPARRRRTLGRVALLPACLGRDRDVEVPLRDPAVSRRHALLRAGDDGITIEDAGSRGGVRIGGARVDAPLPLRGIGRDRPGRHDPALHRRRAGRCSSRGAAASTARCARWSAPRRVSLAPLFPGADGLPFTFAGGARLSATRTSPCASTATSSAPAAIWSTATSSRSRARRPFAWRSSDRAAAVEGGSPAGRGRARRSERATSPPPRSRCAVTSTSIPTTAQPAALRCRAHRRWASARRARALLAPLEAAGDDDARPARGGPPARRAGRGGGRRPGGGRALGEDPGRRHRRSPGAHAPGPAAARPAPTSTSTPRRRWCRPRASRRCASACCASWAAAPPRPSTWRATRRCSLDVALKVLHPQLVGLGPIRVAAPLLRRRARRRRRPPPGRRRDLRRRRDRARRRDGMDRGRHAAAAPARAPGRPADRGAAARPPAACSARSATSTRRASSTAISSRRTCCCARPGEVVLADFGVGRADGRRRAAPPARRRTPLYFAPEQFQGAPARRPPISTRSARSSGRPRPAARCAATPT